MLWIMSTALSLSRKRNADIKSPQLSATPYTISVWRFREDELVHGILWHVAGSWGFIEWEGTLGNKSARKYSSNRFSGFGGRCYFFFFLREMVEDVTVPAVSWKITRRACLLPGPRLNMQVKATIVATQAVEKHRSIGKGCFVWISLT
jgi:hypothetical protein